MNNRAHETLQQRARCYCRERNDALDQLEKMPQKYDAEQRRRVAAEDQETKTREEYDALRVTHKALAVKFNRLQFTARLEGESTKKDVQRQIQQLEEAKEALREELKELTAWRKGLARQQASGQPDWQGYKHTTDYSKKKCFSNALGYTLVVLEVLYAHRHFHLRIGPNKSGDNTF